MAEPAPASAWAAALRAALAAGCPVAPGREPEGNRPPGHKTWANQTFTVSIASVAPVAPPSSEHPAAVVVPGETDVDPVEAAEREAIQCEPPLPPPGSAAWRRMAEDHRRMVAGLLAGALQLGRGARVPFKE